MDKYQDVRSISLLAVLTALGFSEWKERKNGAEFYGKCPVHQAKRNSTSFSFDQDKYHCFSCGAKGKGAIDLVMAVRQCGFQQAVTWLQEAKVAHTETAHPPVGQLPTRDTEVQTHPEENQPFKASYEKFAVKSEWLERRGLLEETLKHFGVFEYNNPNRASIYKGKILFPIKRYNDGECVGYLARNPNPQDGEPKYLFPKGVSKSLEIFGAYQLKTQQLPLRVVYLVESPLCVLKFHQMGFPAVSAYGAHLSQAQITILGSLAKGILYLPDQDKYPEIGASVHNLSKVCWVKVPQLPIGLNDPEYLSPEQIRSL